PNNELAQASLLTPEFIQNVGAANILQANCHLENDVDYYKIELETGYTYRLRGTLYDSDNQINNSRYTLDAEISYSTDNGANWSRREDIRLSPATVPGGTLYLKIKPWYGGSVGTYAAKIEITHGACVYALSSASGFASATGGAGEVTVATTCAWTAASDAEWITNISPAFGTGNATVTYSVAANTGAERTGRITIAEKIYAVTQADASCAYSLRESSAAIPAEASASGRAEIITTRVSCPWAASSNEEWITNISPAYGRGNVILTYSVAANTGTERTGTIIIAGQTYTVRQAGPCTFSLSKSSAEFSGNASSGTLEVITTPSCTWTAASDAEWITVNPTSGTGNATVTYSVAANTGAERTGTL
ncbi:MAG: hypothetical protein CRN43_14260, partial [Candidatus Nephrothrix sp. EaCA]